MSGMKFYYDASTFACVGAFLEGSEPEGALPASTAPQSGRQIWDVQVEAWVWPAGDLDLPPLSARQIRLGLSAAGLLSAAEQAIVAGSEADRIEWDFASEYRRDHPLIGTMTTALGLTPQQVDAMWLNALTL